MAAQMKIRASLGLLATLCMLVYFKMTELFWWLIFSSIVLTPRFFPGGLLFKEMVPSLY